MPNLKQLGESMISYNNVFEIMTNTLGKSLSETCLLQCCKEILYVSVKIIITSGKC